MPVPGSWRPASKAWSKVLSSGRAIDAGVGSRREWPGDASGREGAHPASGAHLWPLAGAPECEQEPKRR